MQFMLEVKALQRLMETNPNKTRLEIAIMLGKSTSWIHTHLRLLKLLPDLQRALDHGRLPLTNAIQLSKLPQERQAALTERALTLNTVDLTKLVLDEVRIIRKKQLRRKGKARRLSR